MNKTSIFKSLAVTTLAASFSASVSAALIGYDVINQGERVSSCGNAAYGLYTNGLRLGSGSSCSSYYSIDEDNPTPFEFIQDTDTGTATFIGTATNQFGVTAAINFGLSGYRTDYPTVKTGGGSDTENWEFYTELTPASSITIAGTEYFAQLVGAPDNLDTKPVFQFGLGANDKTPNFGGSVWLDMYSAGGEALFIEPSHWDLNFDLVPKGFDVSAPATAGLLTLGIVALRLSRRRK